MRILNIFFALVFLASAILQYNDDDPYLWIPIYLFATVMCVMAFRHFYYPKAYIAGIAIFSLYAVYLFFAKDGVGEWLMEHDAEDIAASMQASRPWIEATREFFGLVIINAALLMNYFAARKRVAREPRTTLD